MNIIIPSIKPLKSLEPLIDEVKNTATGRVNIVVANSVGSAAKNRNDGLDRASSGIIVMIDDDITGLTPGWNEELIKPLNNPLVKVVAARLLKTDKSPAIMGNEGYEPIDIQPAQFVPTACVAFRNTTKRFDETFRGSGFEDTDFLAQLGCLKGPHGDTRFSQPGMAVINNKVKVVHLGEAKNQRTNWEANQAYFSKKWSGKFKFVALYKTLLGGEWITSSLESVYDYVDKVVFVHSCVGWDKVARQNNCTPYVTAFGDIDHKFSQLTGYFDNQHLQYVAGLQLIEHLYPNHYILLVDSDEVWDVRQLQQLKGAVINFPEYTAYRCRTRVYVKSPFYRVEPDELCTPVVVLNGAKLDLKKDYGPRFGNIQPGLLMEDLYFHHFTAVRLNAADVQAKLSYDEPGDGCKLHQDWMERVWPKIPDVENFHYSVGFEGFWHKIRQVNLEELPWAVRHNVMVHLHDRD